MTTATDQSRTSDTKAGQATMDEGEFLDAQAAEAQAAVEQTWDDLKNTLKETATLEVWAKRHPWMVAGAAVAGGFLVATLLFAPSEPARADTGQAEPEPSSSNRPHRLAWLMGSLFGLLRPIFGQFISSLIAAAMGAVTASMATGIDASDAASAGGDTNGSGPMPGEGPVPL